MGEGVGEGEKMVEWGVNGDERKVNGGIGGRNCVRRNEKRGGGVKRVVPLFPVPSQPTFPTILSIFQSIQFLPSNPQSSNISFLSSPIPFLPTTPLFFQLPLSYFNLFFKLFSTHLPPSSFHRPNSATPPLLFSTLQPFLQPPIFPSVPSIP